MILTLCECNKIGFLQGQVLANAHNLRILLIKLKILLIKLV